MSSHNYNNNNNNQSQYVNLFTTKAYVFYVNPENRSSWIQAAKKAIDVSIVARVLNDQHQQQQQQHGGQSSTRQELRLIAVDDETGQSVLDDNITRTTFDQRSLKFCQWMDSKKLLWGLGFDQEGPLEEFIRNVKLAQQSEHHVTSAAGTTTANASNNAIINSDNQGPTKLKPNLVKQALGETSTNANLWEKELEILRTNNAKLTQALQESKANVEQWEIELATLQKENKELKKRLMSMENSEQKNDLIEYKKYVEELRKEVAIKDKDIEKLQVSMEELALSKKKSEDQLNNNRSSIDHNCKQSLTSIRNRLEDKINELKSVSHELRGVIDEINQ